MQRTNLLQMMALLLVLVLLQLAASAQVQINGTVYDRSARFGMQGVSVKSNSGAGAVTDSLGRYSIRVPLTDSISFSYQGKSTQKFAVKEIRRSRPFDMSLHVDIKTLPTVTVSAPPRSYSYDSLQTRNEYRKMFDYEADYLSMGTGVGLNLDVLLNMKKVKQMETFRRRLEAYEREKYVSYRFNKVLVQKITGLESPALDTFMEQFRPSYELLRSFENDYQYYKFIQDEGRYFSEVWRSRRRM